MALCDPFLFLLDGEAREKLGTLGRPGRYVENASKDVGNLESQQTEGHICEALALFGELGHAWEQVGVVDVKGLDDAGSAIVYSECMFTHHLRVELCFDDSGVTAMVLSRPRVEDAHLPP
jgi:hypothetical protein